MKSCDTCAYLGADPDGAYCGHPDGYKYSMGAGLNLNRARGPNGYYPESEMSADPAIGICGPDAKLYKLRTR